MWQAANQGIASGVNSAPSAPYSSIGASDDNRSRMLVPMNFAACLDFSRAKCPRSHSDRDGPVSVADNAMLTSIARNVACGGRDISAVRRRRIVSHSIGRKSFFR